MGLTYQLSAGNDAVKIPMGPGETAALTVLRQALPTEVDLVFGAEDFGRSRSVDSDDYMVAAKAMFEATNRLHARVAELISWK